MDVLAFLRKLRPRLLRAFFARLRNVFFYIFNLVIGRRLAHARMASPVDSKAASEEGLPRRRQMIGLKTKEECRLGQDTLTVWTVELPRKHAEGVLRYASCLAMHTTITDIFLQTG